MSAGMLTGLALAILLCVVCLFVPFFMLYTRSKQVETGMFRALAFGGLGYLWAQVLLYSFLWVLIISTPWGKNMQQNYSFFLAILQAIVVAVFAALANIWGIYLTNEKQKSLYRSATVGLGYGAGKAIILFYAIFANIGKTNVSLAAMLGIGLRTAVEILLSLVVALYVGKFFNEKKYQTAIGILLGAYGGVSFVRILIDNIPNDIAVSILQAVFAVFVGLASIYLFMKLLPVIDKEVKQGTQVKKVKI